MGLDSSTGKDRDMAHAVSKQQSTRQGNAMIDLNHVHPRHDAIDRRLIEWAKWVRVHPTGWFTAPMFRLYRAPRQWASDLELRIEINTIDAAEIERAVSFLPDKHRTAIRWFYVFPKVPAIKVRSELGTTLEGLREMVYVGRDMLKTRLKERLIEK